VRLNDDNNGGGPHDEGGMFNGRLVVERRKCSYVEEGTFVFCNTSVQKWKKEK